jgi:hypothetical protein
MGCALSRVVSGDIYSSFRASYQIQVSSGSCIAGNSRGMAGSIKMTYLLLQFEG